MKREDDNSDYGVDIVVETGRETYILEALGYGVDEDGFVIGPDGDRVRSLDGNEVMPEDLAAIGHLEGEAVFVEDTFPAVSDYLKKKKKATDRKEKVTRRVLETVTEPLGHFESQELYDAYVRLVAEMYRDAVREGYVSDVAAGLVSTVVPSTGDSDEAQRVANVFGESVEIQGHRVAPICPVTVVVHSDPCEVEKWSRTGGTINQVAQKRFIRDLREAVH